MLLCRLGRWRRGRLGGSCRLRSGAAGLHAREHRAGGFRSGTADGEDRKRDRGDHEQDGRPGSGLGERRRRATGTEGRLAAHASEGGGNVAALAALQQYHHDQEEAHYDVHGVDKANDNIHASTNQTGPQGRPFSAMEILVRKGGFEPPRLAAPPPQDAVSASSTTSSWVRCDGNHLTTGTVFRTLS